MALPFQPPPDKVGCCGECPALAVTTIYVTISGLTFPCVTSGSTSIMGAGAVNGTFPLTGSGGLGGTYTGRGAPDITANLYSTTDCSGTPTSFDLGPDTVTAYCAAGGLWSVSTDMSGFLGTGPANNVPNGNAGGGTASVTW